MELERLERIKDQKWDTLFKVSTTAGVWLIAFVTVMAFAKLRGYYDGLTLALLFITGAFMLIFGLLIMVAAINVEAANNDLKNAKKASNGNP